jgi:hypothetical protein
VRLDFFMPKLTPAKPLSSSLASNRVARYGRFAQAARNLFRSKLKFPLHGKGSSLLRSREEGRLLQRMNLLEKNVRHTC